MQKCSKASLKSGMYGLAFILKSFLPTNVAKKSSCSDIGRTRSPNMVILVFKASPATAMRYFDNITPIFPLVSHTTYHFVGFELGLEKPDPRRALQNAFNIAIAYILGGVVPLLPYMFIPRVKDALVASVVITIAASLIFGYVKGYFTSNRPVKSAFQITLIVIVASAAAFDITKAIHP